MLIFLVLVHYTVSEELFFMHYAKHRIDSNAKHVIESVETTFMEYDSKT